MFEFQLYSDLHIDILNDIPYIKPLSPYLFLAGDICHIEHKLFKNFFDYCSQYWSKTFYCLGNHEFYSKKTTIDILENKYIDFFKNNYNNVFLLHNSFHDINDDIIVYGSTLWTNVSNSIKYNINDYKRIKYNNNHITPSIINEYSNKQIDCLNNFINNNKKKCILITHFPPTQYKTSHPIYEDDSKIIKNYFSWDNLIYKINNENIIAWLCGHTHYSFNLNINNIVILSNQYGYKSEYNCTKFNKNGLYKLSPTKWTTI